MTAPDRRSRFRELHAREQLFVMPNPWDVGSARLLESCGFEALATTSAGFAWSLGKLDQQVSRDELVAHVPTWRPRPRCRSTSTASAAIPDDPAASPRPCALLAEAGAAGFSIEDYDPATRPHRRRRGRGRASRRRRGGRTRPGRADGAHRPGGEPHPRRRRPRRHDRAPDRLPRRGRGRRVRARAPDLDQIAAVVDAVGMPVNVLALPNRADRSPSSSPSACAGSRPAARSPVRPTARSTRGCGSSSTRAAPDTPRTGASDATNCTTRSSPAECPGRGEVHPVLDAGPVAAPAPADRLERTHDRRASPSPCVERVRSMYRLRVGVVADAAADVGVLDADSGRRRARTRASTSCSHGFDPVQGEASRVDGSGRSRSCRAARGPAARTGRRSACGGSGSCSSYSRRKTSTRAGRANCLVDDELARRHLPVPARSA